MGTGKSANTGRLCPICKGHGELPDDPNRTKLCKPCFGTGISSITGKICELCGGYGKLAPVDSNTTPTDAPLVFFVKAGTPWTTHLRLHEVFEQLSGEICICDPYYGKGSLLQLDLLQHCSPIRFLTQNPEKNEKQTLQKALQAWESQHGNVEFRRYGGRDLHDRYVLAQDEIILLGHGLKDVGSKDSFIIRLTSELVADLIKDVRNSFESKWQSATPIV
jgi:hypothetical protein